MLNSFPTKNLTAPVQIHTLDIPFNQKYPTWTPKTISKTTQQPPKPARAVKQTIESGETLET